MHYTQYILKEDHKRVRAFFNTVFKTGETGKGLHYRIKRKNGSVVYFETTCTVIKDESGKPTGFRGVSRDITQRKQAERNLLKIQNALEEKVKERTQNLQESNVALEVLLKKREGDRRDVEDQVVLNIREVISPYIERLKASSLKERQKVYVEIIERNLKEITAPFMRGLSDTFHKLTPTEIQVINLVKQEKTTKEMANFLGISPRTVEYHRDNIRKKLGIANQKINLRSYLLSIH
jgi:ATP/maltotriose-dependent transcriptional regulator MalT